jgi:hypothetical protein
MYPSIPIKTIYPDIFPPKKAVTLSIIIVWAVRGVRVVRG